MKISENSKLVKIDRIRPALAHKIAEQGGFITQDDLPGIIAIDRHMLLLVRCGCGRFLAPADTVEHFTTIIREHAEMKAKALKVEYAGDHVRDVSLPAD